MTYIEGFVTAVPESNRQRYVQHAQEALPLVREFGAGRMVEAWSDDVATGAVTDFRRAVLAGEDEAVVFSWFVYPNRQARQQAVEQMIADLRMEKFADLPFDGKRMIFGGFEVLNEAGPGGTAGYVDGAILAVPRARRDEFKAFAQLCNAPFLDRGATKVIDAWEDDVPPGTLTDFRKAVLAADDESVVFGWVEWPSKAVRDAAWPEVQQDPRMAGIEAPFDGTRMVFGGFETMLDG